MRLKLRTPWTRKEEARSRLNQPQRWAIATLTSGALLGAGAIYTGLTTPGGEWAALAKLAGGAAITLGATWGAWVLWNARDESEGPVTPSSDAEARERLRHRSRLARGDAPERPRWIPFRQRQPDE